MAGPLNIDESTFDAEVSLNNVTLGEKEYIEKFALWEKTTHIPFIIVYPPLVKPGTVIDVDADELAAVSRHAQQDGGLAAGRGTRPCLHHQALVEHVPATRHDRADGGRHEEHRAGHVQPADPPRHRNFRRYRGRRTWQRHRGCR